MKSVYRLKSVITLAWYFYTYQFLYHASGLIVSRCQNKKRGGEGKGGRERRGGRRGRGEERVNGGKYIMGKLIYCPKNEELYNCLNIYLASDLCANLTSLPQPMQYKLHVAVHVNCSTIIQHIDHDSLVAWLVSKLIVSIVAIHYWEYNDKLDMLHKIGLIISCWVDHSLGWYDDCLELPLPVAKYSG